MKKVSKTKLVLTRDFSMNFHHPSFYSVTLLSALFPFFFFFFLIFATISCEGID